MNKFNIILLTVNIILYGVNIYFYFSNRSFSKELIEFYNKQRKEYYQMLKDIVIANDEYNTNSKFKECIDKELKELENYENSK